MVDAGRRPDRPKMSKATPIDYPPGLCKGVAGITSDTQRPYIDHRTPTGLDALHNRSSDLDLLPRRPGR